MAILSALYFLWPAAYSQLLVIIGVTGAMAVAVGIRHYRPRRAWTWWMFAATLTLHAAATALYYTLPGEQGTLKPWIWTVWILHLAMFVCLAAGLVGLAGWSLRGTAAIIDTTIVLLGAGLLFGVLIAIPYASTPGIGPLWAGIRVAYVIRDVLVLALAAHLATAVRRSASAMLLLTGLGGLVLYDVLFRLGRIRGEWLTGTAIDLGWLLFFIAVGAAALVPSMVTIEQPSSTATRYPWTGPGGAPVRLGLVLAAALIPFAVLLIGLFRPPPWYQAIIVTTATVMLLLALARSLDVASQLRGQIRGERAIRDAVTELADAEDIAAIRAIADRTVGRLLSSGSDYQVALARVPASLTPMASTVTDMTFRPTADLPATVTAQLGARGVTLIIPLGKPSHPAAALASPDEQGSGHAGPAIEGQETWALLLRGPQRSLAKLRPRLEVLGTQAGLALERMRLNEEIIRRSQEEYFRTLVQSSTDVILIIDDDDTIRYASPSAASLFGPLPTRGVSLLGLVEPGDRRAASGLLRNARAGEAAAGSATVPVVADWTVLSIDGPSAQVEVSCRDLRADPSIGGLVLTLRDVTSQRLLERELAQRAFRDPLTGLANRVPFSERLDAATREAVETDTIAGILYLDLDDLKAINDGLGHEVGDSVLRTVAQRLREFVTSQREPSADMAARFADDEFAVLVTGISDPAALEAAADRLAVLLAQPTRIGGGDVSCTASIGVATTANADSGQVLLRNADLALSAAKSAGKRQWRRYEPWMRASLAARLELRSQLEGAVQRDELFLEYQPIVSLPDTRTVGFEALLRWQHPSRGRLAPDTFIDVAEESGLIIPIGEWVLAHAFDACRRWGAESSTRPYVAVNVSARQFRSPGFADRFTRLLTRSGLRPDRVLIEITESLLLRDDDVVWLDLRRLRATGVRVAIDDFGTGYSALSYLRQVPLDVVKLDRSFIRSMVGSTTQRRLVQGIVGLARILELHVVAEGIETETERLAAMDVGCDFGQGFRFAKPIPEDEVPRWLGEQPVGANLPVPSRPSG